MSCIVEIKLYTLTNESYAKGMTQISVLGVVVVVEYNQYRETMPAGYQNKSTLHTCV